MGSGLSVLLIEDTKDMGSDFVVNDGLVVFPNNVDAELLIRCRCITQLCMTSGASGDDSQ